MAQRELRAAQLSLAAGRAVAANRCLAAVGAGGGIDRRRKVRRCVRCFVHEAKLVARHAGGQR